MSLLNSQAFREFLFFFSSARPPRLGVFTPGLIGGGRRSEACVLGLGVISSSACFVWTYARTQRVRRRHGTEQNKTQPRVPRRGVAGPVPPQPWSRSICSESTTNLAKNARKTKRRCLAIENHRKTGESVEFGLVVALFWSFHGFSNFILFCHCFLLSKYQMRYLTPPGALICRPLLL